MNDRGLVHLHIYITRISIFYLVIKGKNFIELEKGLFKRRYGEFFVSEFLSKMIHQQFKIPKNEHKVEIKFQLWLILGAHCNLFFGLP